MQERLLVITEKPSTARRIAEALDDRGRPEAGRVGEVTYYIAARGEDTLTVVSALGHLYTLAQRGGGWTYPVYEMEWVPVNQVGGRKRTVAHILAIRALAEGAQGFVSACDYDMEGSLIAYNALRYAAGERSLTRASRMKYSTLTREDLDRSWESRSPALDHHVIAAGEARHRVDWLFGINLSRAITLAVRKASGLRTTLSVGRVQGPTLGFVKAREDEISSFVPVPYWRVRAEAELSGQRYPLEYGEPRVEREARARELARSCRGKVGRVTAVRGEAERRPPPPPFSLGDLQREAYRVHRIGPSATLAAAEKLYLGAYISYPRTGSQRLPPSIDVRGILVRLSGSPDHAEQAAKLLSRNVLRPRQGKEDDPAHPAIYPTGAVPGKLGDAERRVYDLVTRRFMACLAGPLVTDKATADVDVNGHLFQLRGSVTRERGWLEYYPFVTLGDRPLPELAVGSRVPVTKLSTGRMHTKPPQRLNASSLLSLMESEGIGTKATRTEVIDTLSRRGYIEGQSLRMRELGYSVVEALERHCPEILSVGMTRALEADLEAIQTGDVEAQRVLGKTREALDPILSRFKENELEIGREIAGTLGAAARREDYLGPCPACGVGEIILSRNRKTRVVYAKCSNEACGKSYGLPQRKRFQPTGRSCAECGAPVIKMRFHRKPMELCINPECPSKGGRKGE